MLIIDKNYDLYEIHLHLSVILNNVERARCDGARSDQSNHAAMTLVVEELRYKIREFFLYRFGNRAGGTRRHDHGEILFVSEIERVLLLRLLLLLLSGWHTLGLLHDWLSHHDWLLRAGVIHHRWF